MRKRPPVIVLLLAPLVAACGGGSASPAPRLARAAFAAGGAPSAPALSAPAPFEKSPTTTPTFSFSSVDPTGSNLNYTLEWDTDPAFSAPSSQSITGQASGAQVSYTLTAAQALPTGTTYYWRVEATNTSLLTSPWSATRSFTIDTSIPMARWFVTSQWQWQQGSFTDTDATYGGSVTVDFSTTPYWSDNFEGGTLGGFSIYRSCTGCTLTNSTVTAHGGTHSLQMVDTDTAASNGWEIANIDGNLTGSQTRLVYWVDRQDSGGGEPFAGPCFCQSGSCTTLDPVSRVIQWGWSTPVQDYYSLSGTATPFSPTVPYTPGTWNKITIDYDAGAQTSSISINGVPRQANIPFEYTGTPTGVILSTSYNADTTETPTMYYDDFAAYAAVTSGTYDSPPVLFSNAPSAAVGWGRLLFTDTVPTGGALSLQVQFYNGTAWALVPDTALAGNSTGFTSGPVDLSGLSTTTYSELRVLATLSRSSTTASAPTLDDVTVSFLGKPAAVAFTTAPQTVTAGACSGIATVETRDVNGYPSPEGSATAVALSSTSGTMKFYSDPSCTTQVTTATVAAGGAQGSFYFTDTTVGTPTITAQVSGLSRATQTETVDPGPASALAFTTAPQTVAAAGCSGIATVESEDAYGNTVTVASATQVNLSSGSGTMTFYSDPACTTLVTSTTIGAGGSTASFYFSDTTAGSPGITAAATGFTSGGQTETITAGTATSLAFTTPPRTVTAGACSGILTVQARDAYGNPTTVASATTVNLSSTSGSMVFYSDASCTTVVTTATIPASGSTASFYFSLIYAGPYTVTAAASGLGQTSQNETLVAGSPSQLAFTTPILPVVAGACSAVVKVQTRDTYGNVATVATATQVNLSSTSGTMTFYSDASCTAPITSVTIAAAASTASFYFSDTTAGYPKITASSPGLTSDTQPETITAGSASTLAFVTAPQTVYAGSCSGVATVESEDGYGNTSAVATATTVNLSTTSGTMTLYSDSGCTTPVSSVTIAASAATASFYFSDKTAGSPKITASAASLSTTNQTETISPAAPATLVFATGPQTVTAGACSGIVTVDTEDAYGNTTTVVTATTVSLSSTATQMTFCSDPGCTNAVTTATIGASSSATSFYFADTTAGTPTVTVTSFGLTGASQVETVDPGSASKLAFTTPARTVAAGACSPVLTVQTQDAYGNPSPVSGATAAVSLSSTATVKFYSDATCTTQVTSVAIPASGQSASLYFEDTAAESPTVTASAAGMSPASQVETVTAGAPAALAFTTLAQTVAAGACSGVATVETRDTYGNVATVAAATPVNLTAGPGTLTFYSNATCTTQVTSVAIAAGGSAASFYFEGQATGSAGANAASTGLTSAAQTETIVAGSADHVAVTGPTSAVSGATVTLALQTEDAYGNPVAGAQHVTVQVTGSATATLPATTLTGATAGGQTTTGSTGTNGSATVDVTDTATGTVQVCTSDASLATQSCHSVTFGAGAPDHVRLTATTPTAAVGTKVTVDVQVVDASGNPTPTPTVVDVGLATTGSAVLLPGGTAAISVTTSASGAATFQVQDTTAEGVTLSVTSAAASGSALPETKPNGTAQVIFTPGPADHVILTGPATTTAGTATTVTVQAVDAYGNPTTGSLSVCVSAAGSAGGAPTVAPGTLGSPTQPTPDDACGTTAAATGTATVSFTDTTAEDVTLTGTVSGTSTTLTVTVGPAGPDHLLVTPPASPTDACGTASVSLQVVDAYGNPVTDPSVDQVQVTVKVTAGTGTAQIVSTNLAGAGSLPAAQVTGTTGTAGSATVGVSLDAAQSASLAWTATALPAAQASPTPVAFQVGALDPSTSTVVSSASQVTAGTGTATITVTPMDGCGLDLGTGHTVTVSSTYGTLGSVTDVGDGTYTAPFTTSTCQATPATVSASVDGTALAATASITTVCKQVDPTTPVTPATGSADACAKGGTYVDLTVTPVDSSGAPLPPGQSVTVDADPPRIVPGTVTSTTDQTTGATTYTIPVGSNRCSATPRAVTVRVNGTALQTTPMLTFNCLPVDPSKMAFAAAPATAPADGKTPAKVLVTEVDTCGNRAFGRTVTAQATNRALEVVVTPATGTTADDAGKADDGTVTLALTTDLAGRTGVSATVRGRTAKSAPNLVHFTLGDVLKIGYTANVARGVAGQTVTFTATLTSRYPGTLADLTISRHDAGLAFVSVDGAKAGKNGALVVASLGSKKTATVHLVEHLGVGASVAASHLSVDYHAATDDGHRQALSPTVRIPIGGQVGPGGCECGSTGGSPAAALPFALIIATLLLLRRRHADP